MVGFRSQTARSASWVYMSMATVHVFVWGLQYSFPNWLPDLKQQFQLSQEGVNWIASALYVSSMAGGLIYPLISCFGDLLPFALLSVCSVGGYLLFWLATAELIPVNLACLIVFGVMLGLGTGLTYAVIFSNAAWIMDDQSSLFIAGASNVAYGSGAILASVVYGRGAWSQPKWFFFSIFVLHAATAVISMIVLTLSKRAIARATQEELRESETLLPASAQLSKLGTVKAFLGAWISWVVLAAAFLKIGIGSFFSSNIAEMVKSTFPVNTPIKEMNSQIGLAVMLYMIGQTVGRLAATVVGAWKDVTTLILVLISCVYLLMLLLAGFFWQQSSIIPFTVIFSIAYGAMWVVNATLPFYGSVQDRSKWAILGALVLPFGGSGPIAVNAIVGAIYDQNGFPVGDGIDCRGIACFQESFFLLAGLSGVLLILSVIIALYHRKQESSFVLEITSKKTVDGEPFVMI